MAHHMLPYLDSISAPDGDAPEGSALLARLAGPHLADLVDPGTDNDNITCSGCNATSYAESDQRCTRGPSCPGLLVAGAWEPGMDLSGSADLYECVGYDGDPDTRVHSIDAFDCGDAVAPRLTPLDDLDAAALRALSEGTEGGGE